jgi:hypothetical protein
VEKVEEIHIKLSHASAQAMTRIVESEDAENFSEANRLGVSASEIACKGK